MFLDKHLLGLIEREGDYKQFLHRDFSCVIKRVPLSGHLCGYIRIDNQDILDDLPRLPNAYEAVEDYFNDGLPSHAGITYTNSLDGEEGFWIGFDCAHVGDIRPYRPMPIFDEQDSYKNMHYVEETLIDMVNFIVHFKGIDNSPS